MLFTKNKPMSEIIKQCKDVLKNMSDHEDEVVTEARELLNNYRNL